MKFQNVNDIVTFFSENDTYFDTSAIMNNGFEALMKKCAQQLKENGTQILIPTEVGNQLVNLTKSDNPKTAATAKLRIDELSVLASQPIIKFVGNPKQKQLAPQQIIKLVVKYRNSKKLAVVTCTHSLAHDILMQNDLRSFKGNHIHAFNISQSGHLYDYEENESQYKSNENNITSDQEIDSETARILDMFGLR